MPPSVSELEALDDAVRDLLCLYDAMGVTALFLAVVEEGRTIEVRCLDPKAVGPICRRVAAEHDAPPNRTLN